MDLTHEERAPGDFLIRVDGDLDLATGPRLRDAAARLATNHRLRRLVVDLSGVRFLDSSGVRALLQARRAATDRGAAFLVRRPSGFVARVLQISAVDQLLELEDPGGEP